MLTVYAVPVSLYCAKLRILLRAKRLEWREILPPGGYGSQQYRAIVASGNLPALQHDDLLLADSEAVAEYLEERFPDPAMMPATIMARARMRERSRFHDCRLEPALRKLFPCIDPSCRDSRLQAVQSSEISLRLEQLARLLDQPPELSFGLGDCGYPVTFAWIDQLESLLGLNIRWPQRITTYRNFLTDQPSVAAELADYVPGLQAWLAGRNGASV